MINGDDPPPLDGPASQSPESLVRALKALGREQPSDAALRATGLRLQARLSATPTAAPQQIGSVQTASTHAPIVGRLIMAALTAAVGVGSVALVRNSKPASEPPSVSAAQLPTRSPASEATPVTSSSQHASSNVMETRAAGTTATTRNDSSASRRDKAAHRPSPKAAELRRAREQVANRGSESSVAPTPAPIEAPLASTVEPVVPPAQVAAAAQHARQPSSVEPAAAPIQAAAAAGELTLLLDARRQSHSSPSAVLRLTAEHARRFPHGVLAPEREVLAIEALRSLGRSEQADERLRRFRAAYPGSIHIRTLTTGATR